MTATGTCQTCGTEPLQSARFCHSCGSPISTVTVPAEYKQVTVLFVDVVRSMDIAVTVGTERLHGIMTELFHRCAAVVQRYGGTVDKFTGDGIMALFGAPVSLEDHAFRACRAALEIQAENHGLADEVQRHDGVLLELRIGLNSGKVIAGEIDANPLTYTAIGEQVGLAQRMESVAPPGGVMLSESTARLVEHLATLGEPELVQIKGVTEPVRARRLLAAASAHLGVGRQDPSLVGRTWEMGALSGILDQAIDGAGCVVGVVGPPGIGKSRIVREVTALAQKRGVEVFAAYCESHANEIPFHTVTSLLRTALGVTRFDDESARARIRERVPDGDPEDLVLLDDLLGIRDGNVELPAIDPDARRRRLTKLVNTISLARTTPAVYVVEDVHWIDDVSESLLAQFLVVAPQTPSLVLITYRPEYRGALTRTPNSQTITLAPLNAAQSATLATELIGSDPSVAALCDEVAQRAAGNPFFAEEIVRDLAERGVLTGGRGQYVCHVEHADTAVPATLQATIAARIDRLNSDAKRTLNAAAVIGLRFSADELALLDGDAEIGTLIEAELVDQVRFTPHAEYAFRHPLIRTVAYESQLKSSRAELHRRLAIAIEQRHPDELDENAALIAEHLEAADELTAAFEFRMRAGNWAQHRNIRAAYMSWRRACDIADRLPVNEPTRLAMRIASRTCVCGSAWRVGKSVAEIRFEELRELCAAAGDKLSLAIGMSGLLVTLAFHGRDREAAQLATEAAELIESSEDPDAVALLTGPIYAKSEAGEMSEVLSWTQRIIDWSEGDPTKGSLILASPLTSALAWRGLARFCHGLGGWAEDLDLAMSMGRDIDPLGFVVAVCYKSFCIALEPWRPDQEMLRETAAAVSIAERSGDDLAVALAGMAHAIAFAHQKRSDREAALALLTQMREDALQQRSPIIGAAIADIGTARVMQETGDLDTAIGLSRKAVDRCFDAGAMNWRGEATAVLVESLLMRGKKSDIEDARSAIDRLAAVPTEPGFVLFEIPLLRLRALLARANGDETGYRSFVDRYRTRANEVGYKGHIALAEAM